MRSDVLIVIPTLDEAAHLDGVLRDLRGDGVLAGGVPVWIMDGGSRDATRRIAARWARQWPAVSLRDNPRGSQAAAVNLAARLAQRQGARVLIRLDAHARYPVGFVAGVVDSLNRTGADSVVVPLIARVDPARPWARAAARLQRGWLGHGGAAHRRLAAGGGWVVHGHHAAFRLDRFLALGGYDTGFAANEDAEFDRRLIAAGGRIWHDPHRPVAYRPRGTPRALWRQMHRNGYWRLRNAQKHHARLGLRQSLPTGLSLALMAAPAAPWLGWAAALPALAYALMLAGLAIAGGRRAAPLDGARMALLAALSHVGYGTGVLRGMLSLPPPAHRKPPARRTTPPPRLSAS